MRLVAGLTTEIPIVHAAPPRGRAGRIVGGFVGSVAVAIVVENDGWSENHDSGYGGRRAVAIGARTIDVDPAASADTALRFAKPIGDLLGRCNARNGGPSVTGGIA